VTKVVYKQGEEVGHMSLQEEVQEMCICLALTKENGYQYCHASMQKVSISLTSTFSKGKERGDIISQKQERKELHLPCKLKLG